MVAYYEDGSPVRFPRYPADFITRQATFINLAANAGKHDGGTSEPDARGSSGGPGL